MNILEELKDLRKRVGIVISANLNKTGTPLYREICEIAGKLDFIIKHLEKNEN